MNSNARYAAAGFQAGILGALGLVVWMLLASRFFEKSAWWIANLLASAFHDGAIFRSSFGRTTLTGIALLVCVYAMLGVLFGILWRDRTAGASLFAAAIGFSILAFYILRYLWRQASPGAALETPYALFFTGHIVFGLLLGQYAVFRDHLSPETRYDASK